MAADRRIVAQRQAQLLRTLVRGGPFPAGFDPRLTAEAAAGLRRKRARAVARSFPAVARAVGDRFAELFDAYALGTPPPGPRAVAKDGRRFARSLPADVALTDAARAELLSSRAARRRTRTAAAARASSTPRARRSGR